MSFLKRLLILLFIWIAFNFICVAKVYCAKQLETNFKIKYRSSERIYLEGGKKNGLQKGDELEIRKDSILVATLKIVYLSNYSSSCEFILINGKIHKDDVALVTNRFVALSNKENKDVNISKVIINDKNIIDNKSTHKDQQGTQVSGNVSLQISGWSDNNNEDYDYTQTAIRLNVKARSIGGKPFDLTIRTKSEYDQRNYSYSNSANNDDWNGKVYEMSLSYGKDEKGIKVSFGRILPRKIANAGYVDGLSVDLPLGDKFRVGSFAGIKPEWQYLDNRTSLHKYGFYLSYKHGSYQSIYFENNIAISGEYHGSSVSRELLYIQGRISSNRKWSGSYNLEIDLNRNWRKDRTGENYSLSSIYMNFRYKFSNRLNAGISYDNRKNYWTYEIHNLAEQLFDNQLRTGIRAFTTVRLPLLISFHSNIGYRKRQDDPDATYSYSFRLYKNKFISHSSSFSLFYSGYSNSLNDGKAYQIRFTQSTWRRGTFSLGYGINSYQANSNESQHSNSWLELGMRSNLFSSWFIDGQYEMNSGDDIAGNRFRLEIGYRL